MKHLTVYMVLVLVIFIGICGVFLVKKDAKKDVPAVVTEELPVRLVKEEGFVTYRQEASPEYSRLEAEEIMLPNNVYVKTNLGRGYVVLPDNSVISLNQNTEILVKYSPKKTSIKQLLGTTYHRVMALGKGNEYEVRTPGTLAAVRGTKFAISYDGVKKKTHVSVTEHKVAVSTLNKEMMSQASTTAQVAEEEYMAQEGETMMVEEIPLESIKESPKIFRIKKDDPAVASPIQAWVEENKTIDTVFDEKKDKLQFMKEMTKQVNEDMKKEMEVEKTSNEKPVAEEVKETKRKAVLEKVLERVRKQEERKEKQEEKELKNTESAKSDDGEDTPTETGTTRTKSLPVVTKDTTAPVKPTATDTTLATQVTKPVVSLVVFDVNKENLTPEEEAFSDTFYSAYEKYLYVDKEAKVCGVIKGLTGRQILGVLNEIATNAGYILPKQSAVLLLATNIATSCADGSILTNVSKFQTAFDVAYPYSE